MNDPFLRGFANGREEGGAKKEGNRIKSSPPPPQPENLLKYILIQRAIPELCVFRAWPLYVAEIVKVSYSGKRGLHCWFNLDSIVFD